jgi:hypothetical protein
MSAYYVSPEQEQLAPVLVAFAGPAPQSRATVLIRALLVIPQLAVLWALAGPWRPRCATRPGSSGSRSC